MDKRPYIFSSDKEDIAIISFQKNKYKSILANILKQECKPIPIDSIDTTRHHKGESFFLPVYQVFLDHGKKTRSKGISPGEIKSYDPVQSSFTIDHYIDHSNSGAPIILNDKIIGVLSKEEGVLSNTDILREPYRAAQSAIATKASCILSLLKKLQDNEKTPGF